MLICHHRRAEVLGIEFLDVRNWLKVIHKYLCKVDLHSWEYKSNSRDSFDERTCRYCKKLQLRYKTLYGDVTKWF